jgi:protocatechuate 3,4-dioxygenase beta subunit
MSLKVAGRAVRDRVLLLVASASAAGVGLMTLAAGFVAAIWLAGTSLARDDAPAGGKPSIQGRVLDEAGRPVSGARVRLYYRNGRWERRHPMIEETTAGPDGAFALKTDLKPLARSQSRGLPPYVLLSDHPGKAVGWRTIPGQVTRFEGDILLTRPTERTITVVDADRRPIHGAKVVAYSLGDPSSASPQFQDMMELLRPDDGPLTATTDVQGHATLRQLPRTLASFVASKPGLADNYAFREQDTIHLTPSASLSGTLTGPAGQPIAGVKVVAFADFMWEFENAVTDARGRYEFKDLKARGWDMSAWGPHSKPGNGTYKFWIESDRFAVPTQVVALEPGEPDTLDLQAEKAGVIRVTVTERGTGKPVANVRIWGIDPVTGSSGRFNAYTDEQGRATFYSTPARISLSITGPPEGVYIKGDLGQDAGSSQQFEFDGGETDIALTLPPITGPLISVSGVCTRPDGTPAGGAGVSASAGRFIAAGRTSYIPMRRAESGGRFTLEDVPAGQPLLLYAESEGRKFAGTADVRTPEKADPTFRVRLRLEPTVAVEMAVKDTEGNPVSSRKFHITPRVGDEDFPFLRRTVESNADGKIRVDGIVRGLSYRIQEDVPPRDGPVAPVDGRPTWHEEVRVLVPKEAE